MITVCPHRPCIAYHTGHVSHTYPQETDVQEGHYHQPSSPPSARPSARRNSGRREHIFHHQPPGSSRTSLRRSQNGDLVLERRTSHSATTRPETAYNHARRASSPSLSSRRPSTTSNTRSGRRLSQVMPNETAADYSFERSHEHYHVNLPMPPRASARQIPPPRTGAEPVHSPAASVRPVSSLRGPAESTRTRTQGSIVNRESKADEQHIVLENLGRIRHEFERNIKPQIQAMFADSTLSRNQAKDGCEAFREMLIDRVVDPCRAAACPNKLGELRTTDAARAKQLQEALIPNVKPWLSQLDQYTADLVATESSFERSDNSSGPESEVGGLDEVDAK